MDPPPPVPQPLSPSGQTTTAFRLQPISASVLAEGEKRRRTDVQELGCCTLGCSEVDDQVLLGGLERGCVVGVSAEEEDRIGVPFGLQLVVHSLLANPRTVRNVMLITPKPQGIILRALRDVAEAEIRCQGVAQQEREESMRQVLDRVSLSCVFDFDDLWAVLADVDAPATPFDETAKPGGTSAEVSNAPAPPIEEEKGGEASEIGDSQEDDESLTPPSPTWPHNPSRPVATKVSPDVILITHFSAILTSLFTSRGNQSAHTALRLAASHLRHLSRALPSHPLILILNSTTAESDQRGGGGSGSGSGSDAHHQMRRKPLDPTLRSIFGPPSPELSGYYTAAGTTAMRRNKPSFGLVFSQMLDLHLLLTQLPKSKKDADLAHAGPPHDEEGSDDRARGSSSSSTHGMRASGGSLSPYPRFVTVAEVLLDEMGVWHGELGARKDREQRWGILDLDGDGRLVDGVEKKGPAAAVQKEVRLSAGFGGRRH